MKVLVIYAHPVETSFGSALHKTVVETLTRTGHSVTDLDLYADGFDPRLGREERLAYHDVSGNQQGLERYVGMLRETDAVVFCFPVWCFGVPAILKGFFDRVLMPGVAFDLRNEGRQVTPELRNIHKIAAVTTYGRPRWMVRFGIGDLPRAHITRYFRWFCARKAKVTYLAHYHMNRSTQESRTRFLAKVERRMASF